MQYSSFFNKQKNRYKGKENKEKIRKTKDFL